MEIIIKKEPLEQAQKINIAYPNWGFEEYLPETTAQLSYDDTGFQVKFVVKEQNPQIDRTVHHTSVCNDSCVEFFANFDPEHSDKYINFEVNAIGTVNAALRASRTEYVLLTNDEIAGLQIKPFIEAEEWGVIYHISEAFLQSKYPEFKMETCKYIKANMYQCGNEHMPKHRLSLFPVLTEKPDFHRPEFFGIIKVEQDILYELKRQVMTMEITIKNQPLEQAEKINIAHVGWGMDTFTPETYAQVVYDETGFTVKFTVKEKDPQWTATEHLSLVCNDSCVEFFAKFDPEHSDYYVNLEVNPLGTMYAAFRTDRYNSTMLSLEDVKGFHIQAAVEDEYWTITYHIGVEFLQSKYPGFTMENCKYIMFNMYECGLNNQPEHYLSLFPVGTPSPDFHRPEYFGVMKLV